MRVIKNDDVFLKIISEDTETRSPRSEIYIEEAKLKSIINGVVLEACIEHEESYLVFTTNDCPFEESLNIYLLSRENEITDSVTMFWPYGTGTFNLLGVVCPRLVQFNFFGEKDWQVEIFKNKRLHIPCISEPSGVWRKGKLWRYFGVSEVPPKD